jgi:hypothetical protein
LITVTLVLRSIKSRAIVAWSVGTTVTIMVMIVTSNRAIISVLAVILTVSEVHIAFFFLVYNQCVLSVASIDSIMYCR